MVADCLAQLRQILDEHGGVWLRFDRGSLDFCGVRLSDGNDTRELRKLLQRGQLRCLHLDATIDDRDLGTLLQLLGTFASKALWRDAPLWHRLGDAALPGVRFVGSADRDPRHTLLASASLEEDALWEGCWNEEIQRESERELALDLTHALAADLADLPQASPFRERALVMFKRILQRLVGLGRLSAALSVMDTVGSLPFLTTMEQRQILECLAAFRTDTFLRQLLSDHPPATNPAVVPFVTRLGPLATALLLEETLQSASPALDDLLDSLVKQDPSPFLAALESQQAKIRERALEHLADAGSAIPAPTLEGLLDAPAAGLRLRAITLLLDQHRERLPDERLCELLEGEESQAIRLILLRRLAVSPRPTTAPLVQVFGRLIDWLAAHRASVTPPQRRLALTAIARSGTAKSVDYLVQQTRTHEFCETRSAAVRALASIKNAAAIEALQALASGRDEEVAAMSQEALDAVGTGQPA
ncbi:MAG: hypothetical protein CMJ85_05160 [Planctomycetes bacterium]|nr:hypothetical protein [Planctomycetota bacterium]